MSGFRDVYFCPASHAGAGARATDAKRMEESKLAVEPAHILCTASGQIGLARPIGRVIIFSDRSHVLSRGTQVQSVRKILRARSTGRFPGASWTAVMGAAALAIAGCTHNLGDHRPTSAATAESQGPDAGSPARVRLLTGQQYDNVIADVFGSDIQPGTPLPPLRRTDGLLETGSASVGVTAGQVMQLQRSAVLHCHPGDGQWQPRQGDTGPPGFVGSL